MKLPQLVLTILLSAAVAFVTGKYVVPQGAGEKAIVQESAYDRVLRTGILRCGYADWPPAVFAKDPTTGKTSGMSVDIIDAIAAKLKVKVEWTENTGWGSFIESLRDKRIDAFCVESYRNAERGRYVGYTHPLFYDPIYAYVSPDEHRFDSDLKIANQPDIRISAMDGEQSDVIAKTDFPKATEISVPQLGQATDILINVAIHKADIVFSEPSFVNDYIKANPNTLRLAQETPYKVLEAPLAVDIREPQLRDMLDNALAELQNQGVIDGIIDKWVPDPKVFLRVAKPYR
jgi:ABC-type amino acid transport substrate-binding protein